MTQVAVQQWAVFYCPKLQALHMRVKTGGDTGDSGDT